MSDRITLRPRQAGLAGVLVVLAALVHPLHSQGFEGSLTLRISEGPARNYTWYFKQSISIAGAGSRTDSSGFRTSSVLVDNGLKRSSLLYPLSRPLAQQAGTVTGFIIITDLAAGASPTDSSRKTFTSPKKLGTSQRIAGIPCDDYELGDSLKTRACLTNVLGTFVFPRTVSFTMGDVGTAMAISPPVNATAVAPTLSPEVLARIRDIPETRVSTALAGRDSILALQGLPQGGLKTLIAFGRCGPFPAWATAIGNAGFPLRVWRGTAPAILEATLGTQKPLPDTAFMVPAGYQDVEAAAGLIPVTGCT